MAPYTPINNLTQFPTFSHRVIDLDANAKGRERRELHAVEMRRANALADAAEDPEVQRRAREKDQLDIDAQRLDIAGKAQGVQEKGLELSRNRKLRATQAAMQGVPKLQAAAQSGDPNAWAGAWNAERQRLTSVIGDTEPEMVANLPPVEQMTPDLLPKYIEGLNQNKTLFSDPIKWETAGREAAQLMAGEFGNETLADPSVALAFNREKFQKLQTQRMIEDPKAKAEAGAPRMTMVNGEPTAVGATTATLNAIQKSWIEDDQRLSMLEDIEALGPADEFLGLWNNVAFWGLEKADQVGSLQHLSPGLQAKFDKISEARAIINKYRSEEFHKLIGSAQTPTEIEGLIDSILNTKMSPRQFTIAMKNLRKVTTRHIMAAEEAMTEGLRLNKHLTPQEFQRSPEYGRTIKLKVRQARDDSKAELIDRTEEELLRKLGRKPTEDEVMLKIVTDNAASESAGTGSIY